jgi:alcohol dehydrogenase (cytochrome c)
MRSRPRLLVGFAALALASFLIIRPLPAAAVDGDVAWPTYGSDYANTRHVSRTGIDAKNVRSLRIAWEFRASARGTMESSPIVVGDTLYVTTGDDDSTYALDAASGLPRWHYTPQLSAVAQCCGRVNRGVAVDDRHVYLATLDARLIALDRRTGERRWEVQVGDPLAGYSETMAPLVWGGMVFVGSSGAEFGVRGCFSAYRASDGARLWRWWSVAPGWEGSYVARVHGVPLNRDVALERAAAPTFRDAWQHGGGTVWMTPALDPRRGMLYLSTGNPSPNYSGLTRPGDNLFTDSIVALNARTGAMRWYYQETPHDVWDYDAGSPPFLLDVLDRSGRRVPAVAEAGKTGWLYMLNRDTGALIRVSQNFVPQRHLYESPYARFSIMEPGALGGAIGPVSYDPVLSRAFVAAIDMPDKHLPTTPQPWRPAVLWPAGDTEELRYALFSISALDVNTGRIAWRHYLSRGQGAPYSMSFMGGSLSAGGIVFVPDPNGVLYAFDARSGRQLWRHVIVETDERWAAEHRTARQWLQDAFMNVHRALFGQAELPKVSARLDGPPVLYRLRGREYLALSADVYSRDGSDHDLLTVFALPR